MNLTTKSVLSAGQPSARKYKAATLASLADKAPTVRVNVDLDREQHNKLKLYATRNGKSIKDVLSEYVAQLPE